MMRRYLLLTIILWGVLFLAYPPSGFDLAIYQHNALLTLAGQPAFGRPITDAMMLPSHPAYLDYTGAQHLVYTLLAAANGFALYALALVGLAFVLLWKHSKEAALILVFSPAFLAVFGAGAWTDKLIFIVIPLMALLLKSRPVVLAAFVGVVIGFNGLLLYFAPVALILAWRAKQLIPAALAMGAGFVLLILPFFPDSLSGWQYRAGRMALDEPFWWSFWRLLPDGWYAPILDRLLGVGMAGVAAMAYWRRWITLETALLIAVSCVALTGVYNSETRVLPIALLIMALARARRAEWLVFAALTSVYLVLTSVANANITAGQVTAFWMPVCFAGVVFVRRRLTIVVLQQRTQLAHS
jgi:hypothetical protein